MITLATANKIALAALDAGASENIHNLSVVVTDLGGNVRTAMRADGVGSFGIDIAKTKAVTALGFNTSSMNLGKWFGSNPSAVAALVGATDGRFLPIGGGVLVHDQDGKLVGAAAVAGSAPENDERFIIAGIKAAGLFVPE